MTDSQKGPGPVMDALTGARVLPVPVTPVYEGMGPLESLGMTLRWEKWQSRLSGAGTDVLGVRHETYLDVEFESWSEMLAGPYPPPTWLHLMTNNTPDEVAGCAVVRDESDLFWIDAEGHASWMPPSLQARDAALVAEKRYRFEMKWEGADIDELSPSRGRRTHSLQSTPSPLPEQAKNLAQSQHYEIARRLQRVHGNGLAFYASCGTPHNNIHNTVPFQQLMQALVEKPGAVHAMLESHMPVATARRAAQREVGAGIMFVEDCMSSADIISPEMYLEFSFPYTKRLLEQLEAEGFRTVLYFSGNLMPLLEHLRELPFTALAFEEDRKGYGIDLAEVRRVLGPERVLFGNLDALFIERASDDELLAEVARQVEVAGEDGHFLVSPGSPMTPGTSLDRIRFLLESTSKL